MTEESILDAVFDDPTTSVRKLALQINTSKTTVAKVLQEQLMHPFQIRKVDALLPEDFQARVQFCTWALEQYENNRQFVGSILFSGEAGFSRNGVINSHYLLFWADENPHATIVSRHQHQFQAVNVWAGIIGSNLIGPFVLPHD